jgi:NADH-quinone oxidoreductase subunit J
MHLIFFYIFSSIAILSATLVILSKSTVRSVLFLIITFVATSCIWLMLEAEFLAVALVLVYVGAVIVLFLFVVMMIDQEFEIKKMGITVYTPITMLTSALILVLLLYATSEAFFGEDIIIPEIKGNLSNVKLLGTLLYTKHLFAFEVAGMLLLVGMVAAIAISFRGKQERLSQDVSEQINVKSNERLKLVQINEEEKK